MDTQLMPRERLAEIVADAVTRAAAEVTGIFRNERMTWTQQGVHAAAYNGIRYDEEVTTALRMVKADGAAEYEATRSPDPFLVQVGVPAITRDDLMAIIDAAASPAKSCQVDGCRHYSGYQDSGSNHWCSCHYFDGGSCEPGQPDPLPPYRERLADAIMARFVLGGA